MNVIQKLKTKFPNARAFFGLVLLLYLGRLTAFPEYAIEQGENPLQIYLATTFIALAFVLVAAWAVAPFVALKPQKKIVPAFGCNQPDMHDLPGIGPNVKCRGCGKSYQDLVIEYMDAEIARLTAKKVG